MTNFDIIIPTYNRPAYLRRILDYYDNFEAGLSIIVADSSFDENRKLNRDIITSVSKLSIRYLGHYSNEINPHYKFADAVNYAKKKYCVFCADDDFVTLNGIEQSVDFLEKNPDFSVAQGQYIGFHLEEKIEGKRQFVWKFADSHESITFSDSAMRLSCHLSDYSQSTSYGVHRTELLQMVYQEILNSEADPFLFGELLPTMLTIIYGKMKCLDVLYGARSEQTVGISWPTLRDAIEAGTFDEKYVRFRDCLAGHLNKNSRLGIEESGKLVDKAMSAYLTKANCVVDTDNPDKSAPTPKSKQRIFLDSLHLPDWMDKGITTSYNAFFNKPKPVFLPPEYHDDFNKIRLQVLSHSGIANTEAVKSSIRS